MRLRALLETGSLGLRLLNGEDELDRTVRGVMTTDLRDPGRYLSGDELVLTGLAWYRAPEDAAPFVRILVAAGVAGLAAGEAEMGHVPKPLVTACAEHGMPLFAVTEDVAFATVTEHVLRQVSTERAGDLAAVVDRHRRMMSSGPAGGGPDVVLDLLGSDLDLRAWVLSVTGRTVAGPGSSSGEGGGAVGAGGAVGGTLRRSLSPQVRSRLAAAHLTSARGRRPGLRPHRVTAEGTTYSLFPVQGTGPPPGPADCHGQIGVLGQCVIGDTAHLVERLTPERPNRSRDGGHAVQDIEHAPVEVEAHHVLDVLPAAQHAAPVGHLGVSRDRSDVICGKRGN